MYWYDKYWYNKYGYNKSWFDKKWFNKNWLDKYGYDRDWYNKEWYDKAWYNEAGYDKYWYDKYGYNKEWYNKDWHDKYWYDKELYDKEWYNREWYNKIWQKKVSKYTKIVEINNVKPNYVTPVSKNKNVFKNVIKHTYDKYWFDENWFNKETWTKWNTRWFDKHWMNKFTWDRYDERGYDIWWYSRTWYNKHWFNREGFTRRWFDKYWINKVTWRKRDINWFDTNWINKYTWTIYDKNGKTRKDFVKFESVKITSNTVKIDKKHSIDNQVSNKFNKQDTSNNINNEKISSLKKYFKDDLYSIEYVENIIKSEELESEILEDIIDKLWYRKFSAFILKNKFKNFSNYIWFQIDHKDIIHLNEELLKDPLIYATLWDYFTKYELFKVKDWLYISGHKMEKQWINKIYIKKFFSDLKSEFWNASYFNVRNIKEKIDTKN